jgi:hypothetical protein
MNCVSKRSSLVEIHVFCPFFCQVNYSQVCRAISFPHYKRKENKLAEDEPKSSFSKLMISVVIPSTPTPTLVGIILNERKYLWSKVEVRYHALKSKI